jgi:hypothetical protein
VIEISNEGDDVDLMDIERETYPVPRLDTYYTFGQGKGDDILTSVVIRYLCGDT